ncbi:hypothetical protein Y032_0177g574 [Ancylostoma ceylanicum]|uniref:Uncharacterized protein n=1 Tax=Ancylostoma ceylanicum TaxID=53326 RepID=A0A016ST44_9BILA|nr:hypothetical protein Y032_0177g574 [Ancylostoma ceylanicum]
MNLKCPKMASKPVFRDGTCSPDVAAVAASQNNLERTPPLLLEAGTYVDRTKSGVFVISVTFGVHYWNQRGVGVKDLLM